jgi:hypothetical protein
MVHGKPEQKLTKNITEKWFILRFRYQKPRYTWMRYKQMQDTFLVFLRNWEKQKSYDNILIKSYENVRKVVKVENLAHFLRINRRNKRLLPLSEKKIVVKDYVNKTAILAV